MASLPFPPPQPHMPQQQLTQPQDVRPLPEDRKWFDMTRTIAHYQRLEQIGEGTYGQVYRARCLQTNRQVALKKIRVHHGGYWGLPPTVIREIKILKRLKHTSLVKMIEVVSSKGVELLDAHDEHREDKKTKTAEKTTDKVSDAREAYKGNLFLVLEYVSHDLTGLMDVAFQFSAVQIKSILKQLIEGLAYMHQEKYVHRDIKSSNILIDSRFRVKLADFGLARCIEPPILDKLHDRGTQQEFTNKVITLWYRPPEILLGATRYGCAVDVWSCGCIFAELLLGKPLFSADTEMGVLTKIFDLLGTPTPDDTGLHDLVKLRTGEVKMDKPKRSRIREKYGQKIPGPALNLLEKMLELDPNKRLTANRALQSRYFLSEPRAPDNPADLGDLQLGEGQGEFHEFQTKKKRKEAKKIAEKAREEAKDRGASEKEAEIVADDVYREQMDRVAKEGNAGLVTQEEKEKELEKKRREEDKRRKEEKKHRVEEKKRSDDKRKADREERSGKGDRTKRREGDDDSRRRHPEEEDRKFRKDEDDRKRKRIHRDDDDRSRRSEKDSKRGRREDRRKSDGDILPGERRSEGEIPPPEEVLNGTSETLPDPGVAGTVKREDEKNGTPQEKDRRLDDRELRSSRSSRRDRDRNRDDHRERKRPIGDEEDRRRREDGDRERSRDFDRSRERGRDLDDSHPDGMDRRRRDDDFDRRDGWNRRDLGPSPPRGPPGMNRDGLGDFGRYGRAHSDRGQPPEVFAGGPPAPPGPMSHYGPAVGGRGPRDDRGPPGFRDDRGRPPGFRDGPRDARRRDDRGPRDDRAPPRDDRGPPRDDDRGPPRDDRGPPRDDRGPPRDDRGPPRDDRGPPRDDRGAPRDDRGAPRDDRGAPREDRGPPRDNRGPPRDDFGPPRDDRGPPRDDHGPPRDDFPPPRDDRGQRGQRDDRGPPRDDRGTRDGRVPASAIDDRRHDDRGPARDDRGPRDDRRRDRGPRDGNRDRKK